LIFFRALQAIGAAMTISCGTAIVTEAFPPNQVGKGLGSLGISVSLGFIAGPILGGLLLDWLDCGGWRSTGRFTSIRFPRPPSPHKGPHRIDRAEPLSR
jgi:MFS family permease